MGSLRFTYGGWCAAGTILVALLSPMLVACGDSESQLTGSGGGPSSTTAVAGSSGADVSSSTSGPSTGSSSSSNGGSSTGGAPTWLECDSCLDTVCAAEDAACDAGCEGIEACIRTVCDNLSGFGSPEEGPCQVYCQEQYPASKFRHLDLVNCVVAEWNGCAACSPYPFDFEACREYMTAGACKATSDACLASADCQAYRDCVSNCDLLDTCLACDDTPAGLAGRALLEAHEQCLATECIAENWFL